MPAPALAALHRPVSRRVLSHGLQRRYKLVNGKWYNYNGWNPTGERLGTYLTTPGRDYPGQTTTPWEGERVWNVKRGSTMDWHRDFKLSKEAKRIVNAHWADFEKMIPSGDHETVTTQWLRWLTPRATDDKHSSDYWRALFARTVDYAHLLTGCELAIVFAGSSSGCSPTRLSEKEHRCARELLLHLEFVAMQGPTSAKVQEVIELLRAVEAGREPEGAPLSFDEREYRASEFAAEDTKLSELLAEFRASLDLFRTRSETLRSLAGTIAARADVLDGASCAWIARELSRGALADCFPLEQASVEFSRGVLVRVLDQAAQRGWELDSEAVEILMDAGERLEAFGACHGTTKRRLESRRARLSAHSAV